MGTMFNDSSAWLSSGGNLSLGGRGQDDLAGNATYPYAKDDVSLSVSASLITSDTLPALTYATGDIPRRRLAAATTHKVAIPLPQAFQRGGGGLSPHGILIKSLALFYQVNAVDLTSFASMPINYAALAVGAGLPTVTTLTTTLAGNTLTQAANVYAAVATVTTPAFVPGADAQFWAIANIVVNTGGTCDLLGASWRVGYALY